MSVFDSVRSVLGSTGADKNALWLYVRCARCGTPLAVRVDLRNEPSIDYEQGGYVLYKEMMDSKCFTLIRAQVRFDEQHRVIEQSVDKGEFISREQYTQLTSGGKQ